MDLAEKLAELRKAQSLTQRELAERLHVSRQAVSRWEVGAAVPTIDNLKALSALYGISLDELLCGDGANIPVDTPDTSETETDQVEQRGKRWRFSYLIILVLSVVIVILLGILITGTAHDPYNEETQATVSMEDMASEKIDLTGAIKFRLE